MDRSSPNGAGGASVEAPYLRVEGLAKRFGAARVLDDVTLEAGRGEFVAVLGPSGSGKTTLLRLLAGFERADGGTITQEGRVVTDLPPEARDFGIVFQSYALFPNRTVAGNIGFGLEAIGVDRASRRTRISELLDLIGLAAHADKYPSQLSGGQQQRVALARALALSPGLLLLDEPLSALDANVRAHLRFELLALQRRVGVTALMVTHDQQEALSIADRIVVMNRGRIEQSGPPDEVYEAPANLFVGRFLGNLNALPITRVEGAKVHAGGQEIELAAPVAGLPAGAHLCIRPASVRVGPDADGIANRFHAKVTAVAFLGDLIRLTLRPEIAGLPTFEAEVLRSRLAALPRPGDSMPLALSPRHLMVLADDA